jgi:hypothetical protein
MENRVYRQLYQVENEHWWFSAQKDILLRYLDVCLLLPPSARLLDMVEHVEADDGMLPCTSLPMGLARARTGKEE